MNDIVKRCLDDDELMHYGVLGMKWGVRKKQPYPDKGEHTSVVNRVKNAKTKIKRERTRRDKEKRDKWLRELNYKKMAKHPEKYTQEELEAAQKKAKTIRDISESATVYKGKSALEKAEILDKRLSIIGNAIKIPTAIGALGLMAYKISSERSKSIESAAKALKAVADSDVAKKIVK